MTDDSVVVVYGVPVGQNRVQRIGTGSLDLNRLVTVDPPLDAQLASNRPPWVLRVGIGGQRDGQVTVEIIDVLQVMQSEPGMASPPLWALELVEPAQSPTTWDTRPADPPPSRPPRDLTTLIEALRRRRPRPPILPPRPRPRPVAPDESDESDEQEQPSIVPAGLWCRLFPRATFCN
jgi:hypothetical protein